MGKKTKIDNTGYFNPYAYYWNLMSNVEKNKKDSKNKTAKKVGRPRKSGK
jgi:hypothetical protein